MPKYPEIEVRLTGGDGNAFAVVVRVRQALRRAGVVAEGIDQFTKEATTGDYDQLLAVCAEWVTVL